MASNVDLSAELLRLELALAQRREDALPGGYAGVLHEAFLEFGTSGRVWTREAMLDALRQAPPSDIAIGNLEIAVLGEGVVLATYETDAGRPARRSSIWVLDRGQWRIRFHQGTPR
jgi:ribonuclease HI